ncbi:hypothetical protein F5B18DRAFT_170840 [Nemania serpens]|nr:hypothetical protein F5B18DRAFT_170840 [Nemania serpens]
MSAGAQTLSYVAGLDVASIYRLQNDEIIVPRASRNTSRTAGRGRPTSIVAKCGAEATNRGFYGFGLTEQSEYWMSAGGGKSTAEVGFERGCAADDSDTIRRDTVRCDAARCDVMVDYLTRTRLCSINTAPSECRSPWRMVLFASDSHLGLLSKSSSFPSLSGSLVLVLGPDSCIQRTRFGRNRVGKAVEMPGCAYVRPKARPRWPLRCSRR